MGRRFVRSESAMGEMVDGELVLLNVDSGQYFSLNSIGTRVWELLCASPDLEQVEAELLRKYAVDPEILRRDLEDLVSELVRVGFLREVPHG